MEHPVAGSDCVLTPDAFAMKNQSKKMNQQVRLLFLSIVLLALLASAAAFGQPEFRVISSMEATPEGGPVSILVIKTDNENFQLRVPKGFGARVSESDQSIVFTSQTGDSAMTVRMSTNYAGQLPKMETLRDLVAKKYATASLVQTSTCVTSGGTGLLFDLFEPVSGDLTLRVRDAYVTFPEGSFEFTLLCDLREYDRQRVSFAWLLNSFRLQTQAAIKNL
jgi:hypothetical protein